jgi:serine-type D-Ala-D-Ala carboxypeptidase/endopeptidase
MSIPVTQPTQAQLQNLVEPYLNAQPSGLAFAIGYATGTLDFAPAVYLFGSVYDQYSNNLNLSNTTLFELGSLSKTFTTTLTAFLGTKYNPKWEKKTIGDYASHIDVGKQFHPITLLELANYTSGLPADNESPPVTPSLPTYLPVPYSAVAMLGYLKGGSLKPTSIGKAYTYSNLAFSTLAQIIPLFDKGTESEDLIELMKTWVFGPKGLSLSSNTTYFGDIYLNELPVGYNYPGPDAADPGHAVFPAYYGGGGIVSTPNDVMAWLQLNMGMDTTNALYPTVQKTQTPSTTVTRPSDGAALGLGWFISTPVGKSPVLVFKDGSVPGYESYMLFTEWVGSGSPSSAGVFVLTNSNGLTSGTTDVTQYIAESVINIMVT